MKKEEEKFKNLRYGIGLWNRSMNYIYRICVWKICVWNFSIELFGEAFKVWILIELCLVWL